MTLDPTAAHRTLPGPTDPGTPSPYPRGSSEWWLDRLTRALVGRLVRFDRLETYYRGTQDTQRLASRAFRDSGMLTLFPHLNANHSRLIVNAAAQRLVVLGFRMPGELRADTTASALWKANDMEQLADVAHVETLVKGECPVLVEPNPLQPGRPLITPQDPCQVIVWTAPGDRRIRLAALKTWWDDETRRRAYTLYLTDRIERWQDREPGQMDLWRDRLFATTPTRWERRASPASPAVVPNPLGEVPIVVLYNDPRLTGTPEGEHEPALTLIDLYNKTLMDMATTSHFAAFRQRWGTGVEAENEGGRRDPVTGTLVEPAPAQAEAAVDTMLTSPFPDARFGTLEESDLSGYVEALKTIVANTATTTFTPYHFLLNMPSSVPPSGEAITTSEAPLVDKVLGHQRDKSAGWRRIMALGFRLASDEASALAMREAGEVIWADPERRTESQHVDALSKMVTSLGLPEEAAWEMLPAVPDQIERWRRMKVDAGTPAMTAEQVEAFGQLFRAGVPPAEAFRQVGVRGRVQHSGLAPVTLVPSVASDAPSSQTA